MTYFHIKDIEDTTNVETDYCSLVCPISGTRIHCPVRIDVDMKQGPFDKENVLSKIEGRLLCNSYKIINMQEIMILHSMVWSSSQKNS